MFFNIFSICLISSFISAAKTTESGSSCCAMNECSLEKIGIVSQLMTLATKIQNSARKSENCGMTNLPSTIIPTTTIEPTPTTTTMRNWRYVLPSTGLNQKEATDDCIWRDLELLSLEREGEFGEFREYVEAYSEGWSSIPNVDQYFWTSGVKDEAGMWRWAGGSPVDQEIVAAIQVPPGQDLSTSLVIVYSPPLNTLTPTQWNGTYPWYEIPGSTSDTPWTQGVHGICESN